MSIKSRPSWWGQVKASRSPDKLEQKQTFQLSPSFTEDHLWVQGTSVFIQWSEANVGLQLQNLKVLTTCWLLKHGTRWLNAKTSLLITLTNTTITVSNIILSNSSMNIPLALSWPVSWTQAAAHFLVRPNFSSALSALKFTLINLFYCQPWQLHGWCYGVNTGCSAQFMPD